MDLFASPFGLSIFVLFIMSTTKKGPFHFGAGKLGDIMMMLPSSYPSLFFVVFLVSLLPSHLSINAGYNRNAAYTHCRFGKGSIKLYNCHSKYRSAHGYANITGLLSPDRYLVKLKDHVKPEMVDHICDKAENTKAYSGYCIHKYKKVWKGMLMMIPGSNLTHMLQKEAHVIDHVEVEGTVRISLIQYNPPWGLDRIDRTPGQKALNQLYNVSSSGDGVHVYILDTGIRCSHQEFWYSDGRVDSKRSPLSRCLNGFDGIRDGQGTNDCNGHGTHCAGIVAGLKSGVAKSAFVHPIRAMACDGTGNFGAILAALEWISENIIQPAVLSMSIATQASISIDQAVDNLVNSTGILAVAASGNFLQPACDYSPSRASGVLSVASSNSAGSMSWFSNYGNCTTIFAPGELILSAYKDSDTSFATLSGTSMACPHVAGAAALYLSQNVDARPSEVRQSILDASEPKAVSNVKASTTDKLLNVNMQSPPVNIHPRSLYNATEGSTYYVVVSLMNKPSYLVTLTPYFSDSSIGYFSPSQLVFRMDSSWSFAQVIKIVVAKKSDFLDHSSLIQWSFTSRDQRFVVCPEGFITSLDTDVCKYTPSNPCGQTAENPKVMPSLPFYYYDDTSKYQNVYDGDFDSCHDSGSDVVFQYTATSDMIVNISLCGENTQFDSMLSVYEKKLGSAAKANLVKVACNDDFCTAQSALSMIAFLKGHTYIFMIDGYEGDAGPFDFYVNSVTESVTPPFAYSKFSTSAIQTIVTSEIKHNVCTTWSSGSCASAVPSIAVQKTMENLYWYPIRWEPCDKGCGGGIQHAEMGCFYGNHTAVDNIECKDIPVPKLTQACNVVACPSYYIYEGPWMECSKTCGLGIQRRQVLCMNNLGHIAASKLCGGEENFIVEQECGFQECHANGTWEVPKWSFCNMPCATGKKTRDAICKINNKTIDEQNCLGIPPATEQLCNTQPCQTYSWLVGPWEPCQYECNSSTKRLVQCVDGLGKQAMNESLCSNYKRPLSIALCSTNDTCNDCLANNCFGHGVCMNHTCHCSQDWEGKFCEIPKLCQGMPFGYIGKGIIGCCPSLAIDSNQTCCKSTIAKLDKDGNCCESGSLDACGLCDGESLFLDSINQCCSSIRDEKGVCCASGNLDECHTCDGDGISCATNFTVTVALDPTFEVSDNTSSAWLHVLGPLMGKIGDSLGISTSALILDEVKLTSSLLGDCYNDPDPQHGCLQSESPQVRGILNLTALPIPLTNLSAMRLSKFEIHSALSIDSPITVSTIIGRSTVEESPTSLNIASVTNIQRAGICGNGICERGERCNSKGTSATTNNPLCCLEDCPFVPIPCPIPLHGPRAKFVCANNGVCLDSTGQCDCFKGYTGADCSNCTVRWVKQLDGSCRKLAEAREMEELSKIFESQGLQSMSGESEAQKRSELHVKKSVAAIVATMLITVLITLTLVLLYVVVKQRSVEATDMGDATTGTDDLDYMIARQSWRNSIFPFRKEPQVASLQDIDSTSQNSIFMNAAPGPSMERTSSSKKSISPQQNELKGWRKSVLPRQGSITGWKKSLMPQQVQYELMECLPPQGTSSSDAQTTIQSQDTD